jgi:hypothetical protein
VSFLRKNTALQGCESEHLLASCFRVLLRESICYKLILTRADLHLLPHAVDPGTRLRVRLVSPITSVDVCFRTYKIGLQVQDCASKLETTAHSE